MVLSVRSHRYCSNVNALDQYLIYINLRGFAVMHYFILAIVYSNTVYSQVPL